MALDVKRLKPALRDVRRLVDEFRVPLAAGKQEAVEGLQDAAEVLAEVLLPGDQAARQQMVQEFMRLDYAGRTMALKGIDERMQLEVTCRKAGVRAWRFQDWPAALVFLVAAAGGWLLFLFRALGFPVSYELHQLWLCMAGFLLEEAAINICAGHADFFEIYFAVFCSLVGACIIARDDPAMRERDINRLAKGPATPAPPGMPALAPVYGACRQRRQRALGRLVADQRQVAYVGYDCWHPTHQQAVASEPQGLLAA